MHPETLPDLASLNEEGHTDDHNMIVTAVRSIDNRLHNTELLNVDAGPINVLTRGVVSSTSLDQSTVIQDADDEAVATDRPLYFPSGTYHYGYGLKARTIIGDGLGHTDLIYLSTGNAITSDYITSPATNQAYRTLRDFRLRAVAMIGTIPTTRAGIAGSNSEIQAINRADLAVGTGLDLFQEAQIEATNLYIQGFEYGIRCDGDASYQGYSNFNNVQTHSSRQGVRLENASNSFRFTNCRFGRAREQALRIVKGNQNLFHGCCFEGTAFYSSSGVLWNNDWNNNGSSDGAPWAAYLDVEGGSGGENRANVFMANRFEGNFRNMYINNDVQHTKLIGNFVYPSLDPAASNPDGSAPYFGSGRTKYITDSGNFTTDTANAWL